MKLKTKLTALVAILGLGLSSGLMGQSLTTLNQALEIDFSDFEGTYATLPSGVTFESGENERGFFNYDDPPTLTHTGFYAFRESASDPVVGFVHRRGTGSPANQYFNIQVTNNTGLTITDVELSLDFLQPTEGSRATEIRINWNPGTGWTTNGITNGADFVAQRDTESNTVTLLDPFLTTSRVISYSHSLGIADGDSVSFGFNIRNGGDAGNNAHVGFSNLSVTAVPEPGTYAALIGLAALGFVVYRRRKARQQA